MARTVIIKHKCCGGGCATSGCGCLIVLIAGMIILAVAAG